jgi:hypothetical protein
MTLGRPKGVSKYERPPRRVIRRNASAIAAWCFICKSEHRFADPCRPLPRP